MSGYIVRLIGKVVTVSVETVDIIKKLPELE
jgi:predicted helicase